MFADIADIADQITLLGLGPRLPRSFTAKVLVILYRDPVLGPIRTILRRDR